METGANSTVRSVDLSSDPAGGSAAEVGAEAVAGLAEDGVDLVAVADLVDDVVASVAVADLVDDDVGSVTVADLVDDEVGSVAVADLPDVEAISGAGSSKGPCCSCSLAKRGLTIHSQKPPLVKGSWSS